MEKIFNYINGSFVKSHSEEWLENYEPATGKVYSQIPKSNSIDVENAYQAAKAAFTEWSKYSNEDRSNYLLKIAEAIEKRLEEFAEAESKDTGKPIRLARSVDIPRAISNFRFFATAILHAHEESYDMGKIGFNYVKRKPLGVAGLIAPWNLPLYLLTWKIAPALAVGNTAIAKPSEVTPYTAYLLAKVCDDVGLPKGVLNIVHGLGVDVGESIVTHPKIPIISFTGGTATGKRIAQNAGQYLKKISLELGGKNPSIIFDDADLQRCIEISVRGAFNNQGQICLCSSRFFVQKNIYEKFKPLFIDKVKGLIPNDPSLPDTAMGAIVSEAQFQKVLYYIEKAKELGGNILCGGKIAEVPNERCRNGWFIEPTVIENLDPYCAVNQEEIFGPVVTLTPFETEKEVLEYANSVAYGLSAVIWTQNLKRAHLLANELETGIVWVNNWMVRDLRTPFGGVKESGIGREGGLEALHFYTEPKNIFIGLL
jgi:aminomuconate-semialdehyde/2-hydroxymuconate-6-semialdehyde dehydrogenase